MYSHFINDHLDPCARTVLYMWPGQYVLYKLSIIPGSLYLSVVLVKPKTLLALFIYLFNSSIHINNDSIKHTTVYHSVD